MILVFSHTALAEFPDPVGYVNDFANVLSNTSRTEINRIAQSLAENQGVELAVVTIPSIEPETPEYYAVELFSKWGIGGPEDSGLLILVVTESRDIKVEVGYGLTGTLPSGKVGAILDQFVVPHLRNNDYSTGLVEGAKAYQAELVGESFLLETQSEGGRDMNALLIFIVIAFIVSAMARRRPPNDPTGPSSGSGGGRHRPVIVPTRMPRSGGRPGGGGFGGFGGGRSGGGGAGRKF